MRAELRRGTVRIVGRHGIADFVMVPILIDRVHTDDELLARSVDGRRRWHRRDDGGGDVAPAGTQRKAQQQFLHAARYARWFQGGSEWNPN